MDRTINRPGSRRGITRSILLVSLALSLPYGRTWAAPNRAGALTFAISVGYNAPVPGSGLSELAYADDDAVQNAQLMQALGGEVQLLTALDPSSRDLYGKLSTVLPTHANLRQAFQAVNRKVEQAHAPGQRAVLYLFVSGHGAVRDGQGFVQLADGPLFRADLLALLRSSRADENHVIVDACNSYYLVFARGPAGHRQPVTADLFQLDQALPNNTGYFLSTSAAQASHEWEAFQAGVFSHELRSALRGAADLNQDRRITYEEAAAFVFAANRAVPNHRFRPQFFARPSRGSSAAGAVLVDLSRASGRRLTVAPGQHPHYFVEDGLGVRLLDFHPAAGQPVELLLPLSGRLFVRHGTRPEEYALPAEGNVVLGALSPSPRSTRSRGAEHELFRKLFALPFSRQALVDYAAEKPVVVAAKTADPRGSRKRLVRSAIGIGGLAALLAGGTITAIAVAERGAVTAEDSQVSRQATNQRIDRFNQAAVGCYIAGGAALATYLVWTYVFER